MTLQPLLQHERLGAQRPGCLPSYYLQHPLITIYQEKKDWDVDSGP